ncbi:hypothetical protein MHU86_1583 [Fragilaria crotonensis]|nr:hypothetical protein MHU86_1583 [Fragilaria crotonensis]
MIATALLLLLVVLPMECLGFGMQVFVQPSMLGTSIARSRGMDWCLFGSSTPDDKGEDEDMFALYCEPDGFMSKETLTKVPAIAEMLADGDLTEAELSDFWAKAPKYPDKINADSFLQIYRAIDDLFVEIGDDENDLLTTTVVGLAADEEEDDDDDEEEEMELEDVFAEICNDSKLLSKDGLLQWDEISRLMEDGLLGSDEFETLWSQTTKSPGTSEMLTVDGFLAFNALLDDLFVFDAEELDDDADEESEAVEGSSGAGVTVETKSPKSQVSGDDLPPGVLFSALANDDYLVGPKELQLWKELQTMLKDGDLLPQELQELFKSNAVSTNGGEYLTEDTFLSFYEDLDSLFEQEEDEVSAEASEAKMALLEFLEELNNNDNNDKEERLACGLEADEREEEIVQNIVAALERNDAANVIKKTKGDIQPSDLVGDWKLLYSSSAAMKFNKGLSGIGGSFPNGRFGGLTQSLEFAKFRQDVVYKEQIDVIPQAASFQVEVNGAWELRKSISLFTNRPCTMLSVEPNVVKYGPTSTRGDHWKSLGPMNLLDVTYLDEDLRIMRGNTASDAIFVWQRIK